MLGQWKESHVGVSRLLEATKAEANNTIEDMAGNLARLGQENEELRRQNAHLHRQLEGMRERLEAGESDLQKSKKLLETRSEELKVAQTFLTTADQHSIADVSQMVDELNEEIYQCSVMMSDALIEQRAKRTTRGGDSESTYRRSACHEMEQKWGRDIVSRVQVDVRKDDTILLESLLENALVAQCCDVIQSFSVDSHEFDNRCLAMWDGIRRHYDIPVARRWLAMTHSQLKLNHDYHGSMSDLGRIMTVGGWSKVPEGSNALPAKVEEKVGEITQKAFKIKEAVTEGILSVEIDVFFFQSETPFNSATMRDAYSMDDYSEALKPSTEIIVCSTGLGVHCTKEAKQRRGSQEPLYEVVLKPKVLLPSALEPEHE